MRRYPSASELLAWSLVGAAVGLVAGFALGEWVGPLTPLRAREARATKRATGRRLRAAETALAAMRTLAEEADLRDLQLQAIAVGPGIVELHGWVPSRALRTRAARVVAAAEGIDTLINCLLVHGEDDAGTAALDVTDQPA